MVVAAAGKRGQPMRYIDLMGGQKPHLLVSATNNLGAETVIQYAPSTKFYVADKLAGTPWVTRLPFPVHVVERVETSTTSAATSSSPDTPITTATTTASSGSSAASPAWTSGTPKNSRR